MRLIVRARARTDLDEIFAFSVENWGYAKAASYVGLLTARMNTLIATPSLGRSYDSADRRYLRLREGRHFIYYRADVRAVVVLRVLHDRMQPDLHLP